MRLVRVKLLGRALLLGGLVKIILEFQLGGFLLSHILQQVDYKCGGMGFRENIRNQVFIRWHNNETSGKMVIKSVLKG